MSSPLSGSAPAAEGQTAQVEGGPTRIPTHPGSRCLRTQSFWRWKESFWGRNLGRTLKQIYVARDTICSRLSEPPQDEHEKEQQPENGDSGGGDYRDGSYGDLLADEEYEEEEEERYDPRSGLQNLRRTKRHERENICQGENIRQRKRSRFGAG